ncbi:MAG TPA: hypothetical protein VFK31_03810 [Rhodanobacteraceae bacterium]|nr:hypothetical protein [Rhodanobacteraceae bacterium]
MDVLELSYALAKHIPAMRRAVTLDTDYGELVLQGEEAAQVAALVERLLEARLAKLERDARD